MEFINEEKQIKVKLWRLEIWSNGSERRCIYIWRIKINSNLQNKNKSKHLIRRVFNVSSKTFVKKNKFTLLNIK